eukprot:TRINITY_DN22705_c0_g1_i2.p3 TRINITY_DN22705_c0_g1~~TRINITY_DN22705_c0_g1_i2.p3  ORF type:complete len:100 (-),score=19.54 TRINITY_DN22705_c0_g1_i2:141-440(-)
MCIRDRSDTMLKPLCLVEARTADGTKPVLGKCLSSIITPTHSCLGKKEERNSDLAIMEDEQPFSLLPISEPPSGSHKTCLLYTSPSPRDLSTSRMPSSA